MIRLAVRCRPEQAEVVLAELLALAPNGVEEVGTVRQTGVDPGGRGREVEEPPGGDLVEYAIYGADGELPDLGEVEAAAGDDLVEITSEKIPDDWADRWRDFHEPTVLAGGRVVIRPSWEKNPQAQSAHTLDGPGRAAEEPSSIDVVIDPGQAFGTGAHPTTRMCVELLIQLADRGTATGALVDLGTGSAVLAIAAAKLGWSPVLGVDHELPAIAAAAENAAANGVEIDFERINLRAEPAPSAPTIVANLTAPVLRDVAANLAEAPQRMVLSGLLSDEAQGVAEEFGGHGLTVADRLDSGDWSAVLLTA